jgi:hypothetical protein
MLVSLIGSGLIRVSFGFISFILDFAKPSDQGGVGMEPKGFHRKLTAKGELRRV